RIHLNAQLIDTRTNAQVWAQEYDRDLSDVFHFAEERSKSWSATFWATSPWSATGTGSISTTMSPCQNQQSEQIQKLKDIVFETGCGAALITSSCALTFCRPAVSTSICFCWRAMIAPCSSILRCALRNSLSNIAFTWS